jgi:hypothetical protein
MRPPRRSLSFIVCTPIDKALSTTCVAIDTKVSIDTNVQSIHSLASGFIVIVSCAFLPAEPDRRRSPVAMFFLRSEE